MLALIGNAAFTAIPRYGHGVEPRPRKGGRDEGGNRAIHEFKVFTKPKRGSCSRVRVGVIPSKTGPREA